MQHPEEVLESLAEKNPGMTVAIEEGTNGHTLIRLLANGHRVLTVNEPPAGWPVVVNHHHADPAVDTNYRYCGEGYDPCKPHADKIGPNDRLTREEWDHMQACQDHTPIDTPEKLLALCESLLGHDETKSVMAKAMRMAKRMKPPPPAHFKQGPARTTAVPGPPG